MLAQRFLGCTLFATAFLPWAGVAHAQEADSPPPEAANYYESIAVHCTQVGRNAGRRPDQRLRMAT